MIKHLAIATALLALAGTTAEAQGRNNGDKNKRGKQRHEKRVPPGHMPPAGMCRVWYDGVPPGRQPQPTSCSEAQRVAARDGGARVIYGSDRNGRDGRDSRGEGAGGGGIYDRYPDDSRTDRRRPGDDGRRTGGVAIPRTGEDTRRRSGRTQSFLGSPAGQSGYRDGLLKGREDLDDRDDYDPSRHSWYRSANRGYESRYGSKDDYREQYRRAFLEGYNEAYRR